MTIPPNIIERYKNISALAERGQANEAQNAKGMLSRMEEKYPGIKDIAFPPKRKKTHNQPYTNEDIFRDFKKDNESSIWETFTEKASDFFTKVKDFTYGAIGIQAAKNLVSECKFVSRENASSITVACRVPYEVLDRTYDMTEEEKFAFLEEAAQKFADELALHIYIEDQEEFTGF